MLLMSGRGTESFITDLKNNLPYANIIYIITAYISIGGLLDILPQIQNCQEMCVLVGDMSNKYCLELQAILNRLQDGPKRSIQEVEILRQMYSSGRLKILFAKDDKLKIIHSKGYLLAMRDGRFVCYVGSANLTKPGFYTNKEWMVKCSDYETVNAVYMDFLKEWSILADTNIVINPLPNWENNGYSQQQYMENNQNSTGVNSSVFSGLAGLGEGLSSVNQGVQNQGFGYTYQNYNNPQNDIEKSIMNLLKSIGFH